MGGGGLAISSLDIKLKEYFKDPSGSSGNNLILDIPYIDPTNGIIFDTLYIDHTKVCYDKYGNTTILNGGFIFDTGKTYEININDGGKIIFSDSGKLTNIFNLKFDKTQNITAFKNYTSSNPFLINKNLARIKINYLGGNIIFDQFLDFSLTDEPSIYNIKSQIIITENAYVYCPIYENVKLYISNDIINHGVLITNCPNLYFGQTYDENDGKTKYKSIMLLNYNRMFNLNLNFNGNYTNYGNAKLGGVCYFNNSSLNTAGVLGNTEILKNCELTFSADKNMSDIFSNTNKNLKIDENAKIKIIGDSKYFKNTNLLYNNNNSVSRLDCQIINETGETLYIYNKSGVVYLDNDFEYNKNIKVKNEDVVISYIKEDPEYITTNKNDRYINIQNLKFYKNGVFSDLDSEQNIQDCIFELNSANIESSDLTSLTYLLNRRYDIKHSKNNTIDEILRLIKFGLLKDWPYTPNIPTQPVQSPFYPLKPKYQPCCPYYE